MSAKRPIPTWAALAGCALVLGACVAPRARIDRLGSLPGSPGGRFSLIAPEGPEPAGLTTAVADGLGRAGLTRVERDPAFFVEYVYSERGRQVGAYSATVIDGGPVWLERPVPGPWWPSRRHWVRQLTIRITEAKSGREVYRATAAEVIKPDQPVSWGELADDALSGAGSPR